MPRLEFAHVGEPGPGYIRAGVTLEEARHNLMTVLQSLQGPEIDNKLGPDAADGPVEKKPPVMNTAAIYAMRRAAPKAPAER